MIRDDQAEHNVAQQLRILGICWLLYGGLRLVTAAWLAVFNGTATVMFGALLNRVADPFTLMDIFHVVYGLLITLSVACGIIGVLAGWALLSGARSGRTLAIIAALLSLSSIPLGTTLGIYSLIVFLAKHARGAAVTVPDVDLPGLKRHTMPM
jgi:hypothetical protein